MCHVNRSFTIISKSHFDKVAERRKAKSRKVAEGRTKPRDVACNCGDLQVEDKPLGLSPIPTVEVIWLTLENNLDTTP
jgi:hypothetical protein